jgi:orotidine-5'-phosphate decarboxylase
MHTQNKVIVATDEFNKTELLAFVKNYGHNFFGIKIHSLYDLYGPSLVNELKEAGAKKVWVDAKLHDIPNTVKLRAQAIANSGADILSVHASGGLEMLKSAQEGFGNKMVLGITALTSLTQENIQQIYGAKNSEELVVNLANIVKASGISGLVCSPLEVKILRTNKNFDSLNLVVPGIRSLGVSNDDQKRVGTPAQTLQAGANFLVIGRQLTKAENIPLALEKLEQELNNV